MNRRDLLKYLMAGGTLAASGMYVPKLISIPSGKVFTESIVTTGSYPRGVWNDASFRKMVYEYWHELYLKMPTEHRPLYDFGHFSD